MDGGGSCAALSSSLEHLAVASLGAHSLKLPALSPAGSSVTRLSRRLARNHLRRGFWVVAALFWVLACAAESLAPLTDRHCCHAATGTRWNHIFFLYYVPEIYITYPSNSLRARCFSLMETASVPFIFSFNNSSCDETDHAEASSRHHQLPVILQLQPHAAQRHPILKRLRSSKTCFLFF